MQPDNDTKTLFDILYPQFSSDRDEVRHNNLRFAYYTTADTASKIIKNREVWLRNSLVMNDSSEITYGLEAAKRFWLGQVGKGKIYLDKLEAEFPGVRSQVEEQLGQSGMNWRLRTYLACLSLHDQSEDKTGRLSMWRAYGDVAVVINNTPFVGEVAETDALGAYFVKVDYSGQAGIEARLSHAAGEITNRVDLFGQHEMHVLVKAIVGSALVAAIGTKHPGFKEEREWRVVFQPHQEDHPVLKRKTETVGGVIQDIWALPLCHDPEKGLSRADLPNLLDRVIIGPSPYPYVSYTAFVNLLSEAGVENVEDKVIVSDIPLRKNS